jgi:hypothetical protein
MDGCLDHLGRMPFDILSGINIEGAYSWESWAYAVSRQPFQFASEQRDLGDIAKYWAVQC